MRHSERSFKYLYCFPLKWGPCQFLRRDHCAEKVWLLPILFHHLCILSFLLHFFRNFFPDMLLILGLSILIFHGVTLFLGAPSYLINLPVALQLPQSFPIINEIMFLTLTLGSRDADSSSNWLSWRQNHRTRRLQSPLAVFKKASLGIQSFLGVSHLINSFGHLPLRVFFLTKRYK